MLQVEPPPPLLSRPWTRGEQLQQLLNSGGSGEESTDSTSDLPQATSLSEEKSGLESEEGSKLAELPLLPRLAPVPPKKSVL